METSKQNGLPNDNGYKKNRKIKYIAKICIIVKMIFFTELPVLYCL